MTLKIKKLAVALIPLFFLHLTAGFASVIEINPMRITFSKTAPVSSLKLTNNSENAFAAQISVKKWLHKDGVNNYVDTSDIIANPQTFSIAKGQSQIVRIGLIKPIMSNQEGTYRLIITELPGRIDKNKQSQVNISFRFLLPIYVAPVGNELHSAIWKVIKTGKDLQMKISNHGNVRLVVNDLTLQDATTKKTFAKSANNFMVFAGETTTMPLKLVGSPPKNSLLMVANTSWGMISQAVSN